MALWRTFIMSSQWACRQLHCLSDDCQKARYELEISPAEQDDSPKNLIKPLSIDQFQLRLGEYGV